MRVQCLLKRTLGFFSLLAAMTPGASAGLITYIGTDIGAGRGDPRPNSDGAAASFDAASGPETVITFESTCPFLSWFPCAQFGELPTTKLMVAPGVFINGLNDNTPNPGRQQIAFFQRRPVLRMGLEQRGLRFIDSFALESPELVPPPKELRSLHFSDHYLPNNRSTT